MDSTGNLPHSILSAERVHWRIGAAKSAAAQCLLEIRFTGRPIEMPVLRQHVFISDGRFRLRGEYKASQLKMEHGLAWVIRCTGAAAAIAQSAPLGDTGKAWQAFDFEFDLPAGCGRMASLQLETSQRLDATLGSRGSAAFDALKLEKLDR
jgi:hypothetical protein